MANDLPSKWHLVADAFGNERLDLAPQDALFYWDSGYSERYSEEQLKEKIEAESRKGDDDPFVQAYREIVTTKRSGRTPST